MVQKMKDDGFAYISDGALVVDVREDTDTKEIPAVHDLKVRRCIPRIIRRILQRLCGV